jgi:adenine-specific DNA-methyltransferase
MAKRAKKHIKSSTPVETIVHEDHRANIPTVELETFMKSEDRQPKKVLYQQPSDLLFPRDPAADPQLVWQGKDDHDRRPIEVIAAPIYIQDKVHSKAIIEDLRSEKRGDRPAQVDLFSDFNGIDFDDLVDFYKHQQNWSNRMILGDSLQVMASLAGREGLKGLVQCIYVDPPYGIKFGSNWQVSTRKRDVKDGRIEDSTRQPEQVRAFRDTWQLGIHSYLSYLKDRLAVSRDLLAETGSIFVQIGEENVHLVRSLLDEVFGRDNFVSLISVRKTATPSLLLDSAFFYLIWYARDVKRVKYRQLFRERSAVEWVRDTPGGSWGVELKGERRPLRNGEKSDPTRVPAGAEFYALSKLTSAGAAGQPEPFVWHGVTYWPASNAHWKTTAEGLRRLEVANRLESRGGPPWFVRFHRDFPLLPLTNLFDDTAGKSAESIFVVQTQPDVIQRSILMTTDPGDLVLDPTCGSGTTAYVAEQWGRRWITIDTSRVALTLARQRLMSARYPYYQLADGQGDLRRGFKYRRVPHITLKSVANNPDVREGMSRNAIDQALLKHAESEVLYDQPDIDKYIVRVTGPFTVESLSPLLSPGSKRKGDHGPDPEDDDAATFRTVIMDNLRRAGVQNTIRQERLTFLSLVPWPGRFIHAVGEYSEKDQAKRAAICIGPQYGTVDADLVRDAAKEAAGYFDILVVCGFAFDAYIASEFKQLGSLSVLKAAMNPDLSMGGDLLKKTGTANLFTVFGEPDIEVRHEGNQLVVEIRGLDVFDPTTGQIRSHTTDDIACWFIDTDYNAESFFIRHAYFTGANDPYGALKRALKADIDEQAWASLYSTKSRPFPTPKTGKIAVKVINHYGDEVMKVYSIAEEAKYPIPARGPLLQAAERKTKKN